MEFSHVDKIYWPKQKITKGDLLKYYATIAPYILPYLKNRPLVMHRFPDGITGESFYQKDAKEVPSFVKTFPLAHRNRKVNYIVAQNPKSLLYVVNLGSIELHMFNSTIKHIEKPDYLVLDLDPEAIPFSAVIETALALHEILQKLKLPHFCKTSGKTGLHIYLPLQAKYEYEKIRQFALILARLANEKLPRITSLERMPSKRQKKVYIDTLQNSKGQLLVAPYSVRAAPYAPVSTPLLWSEVKAGLNPLDFTLETIPQRLLQKGDLFQGVLGRGINLSACLKKLNTDSESD